MAYDEVLAERLRDATLGWSGMSEKKMFGGFGLMMGGNLLVGVIGESLCARVGPDAYEAALAESGVRPFDYTGRPMRGWVFVDPEAFESEEGLDRWLERCRAFVSTLPRK